MALTIDTTISGPFANSYADANYADDYWAGHFQTTKAAQWNALNDDQKTNVLIQATRMIETLRFTTLVPLQQNYKQIYDRRSHLVLDINLTQLPVKYYYYQHLQFPRNLDRDPVTGVTYIPEEVKMAQCEQAVYLLNYDETAVANRIMGITTDSAKVGEIAVRQAFVTDGSAMAPMALEFLRQYLMKASYSLRRA